MKKILIVSFLISAVVSLNGLSNLFAADFEPGIGLVVPLGASISQKSQTHNADADKNDGVLSGKSAFEFGVGILPGFYMGFDDYMGFSIALDLGYKREVFSYNENKLGGGQYEKIGTTYYFDTINIGLLPKFNIARFYIGIGGGIKLIVSGNEKTKNYNENKSQFVDSETKYNFNSVKNKFKNPYIPYIKATFDYLFFFDDEIAFGIGLYAGYDFGPQIKDDRFSKNNLGAFDIGGQISFYFVND